MGKKNIKKQKKVTDKRILYTKMALKQALLKSLKEIPYEKTGIVSLCETAQISRSAFYLHYNGIDDLMEEIINEAIETKPGIVKFILGDYGTGDISISSDEKDHGLYEIDDENYNVLVHGWKARNMIMDKITADYKDKCVSDIVKEKGLSEEEAEIMFIYRLSGMLSAADRLGGDSFKQIEKIIKISDKILENMK